MATQVGMTVIKRFAYRGDATEEFSNTYWFSGAVPADGAAWRTLFDALVALEKTVLLTNVSIIRGYGYNDNEGHRASDPTGTDVAPAVWSVDLTASPDTPVAGTLAPGGTWTTAPGDSAVWVRWKTNRLARGKPVYLRKYYHPATIATTATPDTVTPAHITNLNALGAALHSGSFSGSRILQAPGRSDAILSHSASAFVTTRTLKRRGKRPGS